ncbi:PCTP-like protein isoform X1 [Vespula squamosa]|uniref:PCTP-like protein isoform X1 n=1 Tax=Vespula squamosa TaxID=30214 RepID=A0ABD2AWW3_VESSQ
MEIDVVKIAEDKDFEKFKLFQVLLLKLQKLEQDLLKLYDVSQDPQYRNILDTCMIESKDLGLFNSNNNIEYYFDLYDSNL